MAEAEGTMKDGVRAAERRDQRRRPRQPVHGRSLEHVMRAIAKRGKKAAR